MGSGKRIKYEVKKYGRENFVREILEYFPSRSEMLQAEKDLVNAELLENALSLNLKVGGEGGWDYLNTSSEEHKKRASEAGKKSQLLHPELAAQNLSLGRSAQSNRKTVNTVLEKYGSDFYSEIAKLANTPRTKEWNENISKANKGKISPLRGRSGELSPLFGRVKEKIKCPHCGKEGAKNTMVQWHFDKCKQRI